MKTANFTINKDGTVQLNDVCGAGRNCHELTAGIEKALGKADESSRRETDEMHKEGTSNQVVH